MNYQKFVLFLKNIFEKDNIIDLITKRNIITEELQKLILKEIYNLDFAKNLYFLGWTNLRISYWLNRFSEDLDFEYYFWSFDTESFSEDFLKKFLLWNFNISYKKWNTNTNVYKTFITISDVLFDLNCSSLKDEKVNIKLEIDISPSIWAIFTKKLIKTFDSISSINILDLDTTFAWKIAAILLRPFVKWRDYYDLLWYLENTSTPFNMEYLSNIISDYNKKNIDKKIKNFTTYKDILNNVLVKIENLDMKEVYSDLSRFVNYSSGDEKSFKEAYKETIFILMKKYLNSLESPSSWSKFIL